MKPHHRRCLNAKRAFPRETGLFPRACTLVSSWVQEVSVEGLPRHRRRELPNQSSGQDAGPYKSRQTLRKKRKSRR